MSAASNALDKLLQRRDKLTLEEYNDVLTAIGDVFFEDENLAFAARAALEQMRVNGQLPNDI